MALEFALLGQPFGGGTISWCRGGRTGGLGSTLGRSGRFYNSASRRTALDPCLRSPSGGPGPGGKSSGQGYEIAAHRIGTTSGRSRVSRSMGYPSPTRFQLAPSAGNLSVYSIK